MVSSSHPPALALLLSYPSGKPAPAELALALAPPPLRARRRTLRLLLTRRPRNLPAEPMPAASFLPTRGTPTLYPLRSLPFSSSPLPGGKLLAYTLHTPADQGSSPPLLRSPPPSTAPRSPPDLTPHPAAEHHHPITRLNVPTPFLSYPGGKPKEPPTRGTPHPPTLQVSDFPTSRQIGKRSPPLPRLTPGVNQETTRTPPVRW